MSSKNDWLIDLPEKKTRSVIVIPARFGSIRYPGKPLVKLLGKPMILWVADLSAEAVGPENVYIATDSEEIQAAVNDAGFQTIMTGPALTGTDRLAEAAEQISADIYINVQGDEPLVNPSDILKIIDIKKSNPNKIINGCRKISANENPHNVNIPKVLKNEKSQLVYMSRNALPGCKEFKNSPTEYWKQVCIYAFSLEELKSFRSFGRKSLIESYEDIEILRFFELEKEILMVETEGESLAVDSPADIEPVENALRKRNNSSDL